MSHLASFGWWCGSDGHGDAVPLPRCGGCAVGGFFGALGMEDGGGFTDVVADVALVFQRRWVDGQDAGDFVKMFDQGFAKVERLDLQEFSCGAFGVESGAISLGNVDD